MPASPATGRPEEVLTDNGSQYVTWRGKSAFTKELEKRGMKQVVASPRHPQTLGKIERFWGTLWRECIEAAVFLDLGDAQRRIGLFIDHYNFQRPHKGVDGLVPADRFFGAAPEVLRTLKARVAANALELARHGVPKEPFYLTGQVGGKPFSLHAEGERVILTGAEGTRKEVELVPPPPAPPMAPPTPQMAQAPPVSPAGAKQRDLRQPGGRLPAAPAGGVVRRRKLTRWGAILRSLPGPATLAGWAPSKRALAASSTPGRRCRGQMQPWLFCPCGTMRTKEILPRGHCSLTVANGLERSEKRGQAPLPERPKGCCAQRCLTPFFRTFLESDVFQ